MIEDDLRATFARHEPDAPPVSVLRPAIEALAAKRRRRRTAVRTVGAAVLAVVALFGGPALLAGPAARTDALPLPIGLAPLPDRTLNFLLIGLDPPDTAPGPPRSDTIMIVQVPADRRPVFLISIERDVRVDIPGVGRDRINQAYAVGGAPLLTTVVESITGLPLDGTVTLTLDGLRGLTDALGGVRFCQPLDVTSIHTGRTYPVGCSELDGTAVADLARQRFDLPKGGYGRDRNGQLILISLVDRLSKLNWLTDAGRIGQLLRVDGVTVDLPGIDPLALVAALSGVGPDDVIGVSDNSFHPVIDGGAAFEEFDPMVAPELFDALRNGTLVDFIRAHPDWVTPH